MDAVVIAGYARSPFHFAHKGELVDVRPDDLAAQVVAALVERTGIDPGTVEDLIVGCAFPEGRQGMNVARLIGFLADLPIGTSAMTLNRFCGSSMQAMHIAAGGIRMGAGEAFICAGVESMTQVPINGFNYDPNPKLEEEFPEAYFSMGRTAENVAERYQITRGTQQAFAVDSHRKAARAREEGRLDDEIVPIPVNGHAVDKDGCIRPNTTEEALDGLKPAFDENGTVTAGTSSPLTDGAVATLVCTADYAERNGLEPLGRIRGIATAGCDPAVMGIGPVPATRKALARAGLAANDIDFIEINEAFASQAIACIGELGLDRERVNVDGGALALGHPLGATGARITAKAAQVMARERGRYALATQCIGGGQGIATIIESV